MTTNWACIRAAIPDANDELCGYIVWNRTPYPMGKLSARDYYKAASRFKRAQANKIQLCELCDNIAASDWLCKSCINALSRPHPDELSRRSNENGAMKVELSKSMPKETTP